MLLRNHAALSICIYSRKEIRCEGRKGTLRPWYLEAEPRRTS